MRLAARKMWLIEQERALSAFLFFSLFYFSYLYFYPFDEGVSAAPAWLKSVKDGVYALLVLVLAPSFRFTKDWREWIFAPLVLALFITSLAHAPHTGLKDQAWQNIKNVAIFVPIYHIAFQMNEARRARLTDWIFAILIFAAVTQSIFSFAFYWSGGVLWLDRVYAGLIGNPNSFSLVLNLALSAILAFAPKMSRSAFVTSLTAIALIFSTVLHTFSGSQFAVFIFLVVYAAVIMRQAWLRFAAIAIVVAAVSAANHAQTASTLFTLSGITRAIEAETATASEDRPAVMVLGSPGDLENVSGSVTARVHVVRVALSVLKSPADALLGSFSTKQYTPMDGQFFVFLYNGGLLLLLAFAIPASFVYIQSLTSVWKTRAEDEVALHFMVAAFGITFLASRVLMYYPLNFIFFLICGLLMARHRKPRPSSLPHPQIHQG